MNEDSGSEPEARMPRFQTYHPPRRNDVRAPLVSSPSHADLAEAIGEGLPAERLDRLARDMALDVEQVRSLIGTVPSPVRRLARLLQRLEENGQGESPVGSDTIVKRTDREAPRYRVSESGLRPAEGVLELISEALSSGDEKGERIRGAAADRLLELEGLVELSRAVFESDESARFWFGTTLKALGGQRPTDWLGTASGRRRVRELLYAIEFGFAA